MKPTLPLFFGFALTASTFAPSVLAQNAAQIAPKSGYETLVAAGKLILPGENGAPSARETLAPDENLRRQRLAVARNAPALKMLREALKMPVTVAAPFVADEANLDNLTALRELTRQLRQESDVRLAAGDAAGALDSRLTILELGAAITRGAPLIGVLSGQAFSSIGRQGFEGLAAKLSAPQIRAALPRLKLIDARYATPAETWAVERAYALPTFLEQAKEIFSPEAKRMLATPAGRAEAEVTEAQAREMIALTPETLAAQFSAAFDALIAHDQRPFSSTARLQLPPGTSRMVAPIFEIWPASDIRFGFERHRTENLLLQTALELRAIKLETGAYPATFTPPIDPFSDGQPLIYERDGDKTVLYSVGPDGKDDNGLAIRTVTINRRTGLEEASMRIAAHSMGDILGPIF